MSLYLVTGGAGFIGSHLCDALLARGDTVRVLDDLSTGHRTNLPDGVDLIVGDIADPDTAFLATAGIDGCFHLAAIASVERGVNDWLGTHRANLTGAITIFDQIRRHGAKVPIVYASSAAVYGDCQTVPIAKRRTGGRCRLMVPINLVANCTRLPRATFTAFRPWACVFSTCTVPGRIQNRLTRA